MKTFFNYGTMNSGKTAQLLMAYHNYMEKGTQVAILTPSIDTRVEAGTIQSRSGMSENVDFVITPEMEDNMSAHDLLERLYDYHPDLEVILVDEAQFLSEDFVWDLILQASQTDITILFYGLLKTFRGVMFPTSQLLIETCNSFKEIKTECFFCRQKATFNLRYEDGNPTINGENISIGDSEYKAVCFYHFYDNFKNIK